MPKIVDTEEYKKELLQKSLDLFARKGYQSLTTRELAQELGISTGTLYHYFPSKADLFEQLIEHTCQQDLIEASAELTKAKTLKEKLETLGNYLSSRESSCIKQLLLWIEYYQQQGPDDGSSVSEFFERIDRRYQQAVLTLLGVEDPEIAWLIYNQINGIMLGRLWGNKHICFPKQMQLLGEILTVYQKSSLSEVSDDCEKLEKN